MFFSKSKRDAKRIRALDKAKFDNILTCSEKMNDHAIRNLIVTLGKPIQSDFILGVCEEGQDARPNLTPSEFFFDDIVYSYSYEDLKATEQSKHDFPLSLTDDLVLPWPWSYNRYIDAVNNYSTKQGKPWQQDTGNHYVSLWLPWRIGFVEGGNHSITAGIMAREGQLIPEHVYDMSFLFDRIRTDGLDWYLNEKKIQPVKRYQTAAIFELGRKLTEK